jgi:hypothetical protein
VIGKLGMQIGNQVAIKLNRYHTAGFFHEALRQSAATGADFDDGLISTRANGSDYAINDRIVDEEVLAETFLRKMV